MSKIFKYSASGALILMLIAEVYGLAHMLSQPWFDISPIFFIAGCALLLLTFGLFDLVLDFDS